MDRTNKVQLNKV